MQETNRKTAETILCIGAALTVLALVIGLNFGIREQEGSDATLESLSYFRTFSLPTADGGAFTQENLKNSKVTVFNAWAPWCTGCVAEMPALETVSQEMKSLGVQIVGVVADYQTLIDSDKEGLNPEMVALSNDYIAAIRDTVASTGVTYPILLADKKFCDEVTPTLNDAYPGTWMVDSEGRLIEFEHRQMDEKGWLDSISKVLAGGGQFR